MSFPLVPIANFSSEAFLLDLTFFLCGSFFSQWHVLSGFQVTVPSPLLTQQSIRRFSNPSFFRPFLAALPELAHIPPPMMVPYAWSPNLFPPFKSPCTTLHDSPHHPLEH